MKIQNKSFIKNKFAFTLVELIVVITILAILGTIAFISYQGYSRSARNSKRISDISNIKTSLALFNTKVGRYPEPDNIKDVIYKGAMVWAQGEVGEPVTRQLKELGKIPLDPLLLETYPYSLLNTKKEYEVGCIFESDTNSLTMGIGDKANAAEMLRYYSYIKGDYNGKIAQVSTGGILYIFAVPSIIGAGLTDPNSNENFEYIVNNKLFTYDSYQNIPANYEGHNIVMTGSFNFGGDINDLLLFTGSSIQDLSNNYSNFEQFSINLQNAYSGSVLADNLNYKNIIEMNTTSSEDLIKVVGNILTNVLGGELPEVISCATKPNYSNTNFVVGTVTVDKTPRQNSNSGNPCYYSCTGGYTGTQCNIGTCEAQNHGTTHTSYTIGSPTTLNQVWQNSSGGTPCYYTCTDGYSGTLCDIAPHYTLVSGTVGSGGNGVIKDNSVGQYIGFYWMSDGRAHGGDIRFYTAWDYCANLVLGGYSDWRLPTKAELQGISPLDSNYFHWVDSPYYRTQTRGDNNSNYYYACRYNGQCFESTTGSSFLSARCVRP